MRNVILILMLSCLVASQCVAQKVTVDPNTPEATAAKDELPETDSRLAKKITYEAKRKSVLVILTELSEQSGVTLKAGLNKSDWQVRDRKMNIFAKDIPLASLMMSITRVMKFKWSKSDKDGAWTYSLYMDRKTLLDEEARKAREEERLAKITSERRQKSLESLMSLSDLSPEDMAKLKKENPLNYLFASSGLAKPLSGFLKEVPAVTQALASGQAMDMPASSLSTQGKKLIVESLKGMRNLVSAAGEHNLRESFDEEEVLRAIDQMTIKVNSNMERMRNSQEAAFMLGEIRLDGADMGGMEIPVIDTDSNVAKLIGEMLVESQESGKPMNEMGEGMQEKVMAAMAADNAKNAIEELVVQHPDDPSLHAKVKIKPNSNALPDVEFALAGASGFAVVSDSFSQTFGPPMPKDQEIEIKDLLEKIGTFFGYDWDKRGQVLEFRDKKWFKKRAAQIPDAWLEEWQKTLKDTGMLCLSDIAQICGLTQEQFAENIIGDPVLGMSELTVAFYSCRDVLVLYGAMSDSQRAAVFTESGLDSRALTPEQVALFEKLVASRKSRLLENPEAVIILKGTQSLKKNGKTEYEFTASKAGEEPTIIWALTAPKYVEPEKPKEVKQEDPPKNEPAAPAVRPAAK